MAEGAAYVLCPLRAGHGPVVLRVRRHLGESAGYAARCPGPHPHVSATIIGQVGTARAEDAARRAGWGGTPLGAPGLAGEERARLITAGAIVLTRRTAPPTRWTFQIKPIAALLARYVADGHGWIDPFAGMTSPAEWTNDHHPQMPSIYHLDAEAFSGNCRPLSGVLFDPPYSYRQISEHYRLVGQQGQQRWTPATASTTGS